MHFCQEEARMLLAAVPALVFLVRWAGAFVARLLGRGCARKG